MSYTYQVRRGTSVQWAAKNPVLRSGEQGYEIDKKRLKIGDGLTAWNDLSYVNEDLVAGALDLEEHINSDAPHPVYDDQPSLVLLYQNALV